MIVGSLVVDPASRQLPVATGAATAQIAALHAAAAQSAQNSVSQAGFAWTNAARGPSTNDSLGSLN
ncbi:MAG: hypothetical protein KF791_10540 [Verrucomicrobiae bacterium]|nr:hypothetical protein [Verrucomicrobiae bacterium]